MDTTSDDLTRAVPRREAVLLRAGGRSLLPAIGIGSGLLIAGLAGYAALFGDPRGGIPQARVDIAEKPAAPRTPAALPPVPDTPRPDRSGRRTADQVEGASGVTVVRPDGQSAPESIIVRLPDEIDVTLAPSPDPRLVDRTRSGVLPRVGPDGSRPLDVYARPSTGLASGAKPAGRVAIVVGGLGIGLAATANAITKLPPAVTLAFAPYGQDLDTLATRAREAGHEIMLQVPMEPFDYPDSDPGPRTLTAAAKPAENLDHLRWAMGRFTGYVGIMNYMGGKLTADERALQPILREIGSRGLAFLDDGSSARSVATSLKAPTPVARGELVVDANIRPDQVDRALEKLEAAARSSTGVAVGTASALPVSLDRIARWAKGLDAKGILLVPASAALRAGRPDDPPR